MPLGAKKSDPLNRGWLARHALLSTILQPRDSKPPFQPPIFGCILVIIGFQIRGAEGKQPRGKPKYVVGRNSQL
ncbi:unnamed protein product [Linum trigynum]|uniref:Uncharacterized protein n=1 Tax=Linum trigynum TaxID=586398 RepID=A0AAV2GA61_9ROSI